MIDDVVDNGTEREYRFQTEDQLVNFYLRINEDKPKPIITKQKIYSIIAQVRGETLAVPEGEERYARLVALEKIGERIDKYLAKEWGLM
jgi:hypothetical protein